MEKLKLFNHLVEVDYPAELEPYTDRFDKLRIRGIKLQACSPFREEKHPSFAVNMDNGSWVDSGANEESERKGSFTTLLAFFRGESYEETANYLLEKYSHILDDTESLKLNLNLQLEQPKRAELEYKKYIDDINKPSSYLRNRGISDYVQKKFATGLGKNGNSITIPWHDKNGKVINVKYRSIRGKEFWFIEGGHPIKQHIFGLWAVILGGHKKVCAVESEIDCLYLWSLGIPAIAFGGASISEAQQKLLLNAGLETLIIATDNDVVGQRFGAVLHTVCIGYIENIGRFPIPQGKKDVNEMAKEEINYYYNKINNFKFKFNIT